VFEIYYASETAQVELESGRVKAPALGPRPDPTPDPGLCGNVAPSEVAARRPLAAPGQGLTLVHFSAQRKHFLWDTFGAWCSPSLLD